MDLAELARLIENLIRIGTVADVRHGNPPAVRVRTGGITTTWRPWCERRAGGTRTWNPPTMGEQVVLLCPSGDPSNGIVLCAIPSAANDVPSHSPNETVTLYPDGALTKYDHAAGLLTVQGVKTVFLEAATSVLVKCPQTTFDGAVTVKGPFAFESGMTGVAGPSGGATMQIKGDADFSGEVKSQGISLPNHDHIEQGDGQPVSKPR
jgi:phage baseplate assembly protein V